MDPVIDALGQWATAERLGMLLRAALLLIGGLILTRLLSASLVRLFQQRASEQQRMLMRRGTMYGGFLVTLLVVMLELGFNPTALLGTAGVLTVAIGFASQTAASNVISGLFLLFESSFQIGDTLRVGDILGSVISIDLLAIKLQTPDNQLVRIPNESLIKNPLINLSRFPIRRIDVPVGVAYDSDMEAVREALKRVVENNPLCLDEPVHRMLFLNFADSSISLQFSVWVARENFLQVKADLPGAIKEAFDQAGIEIPFPQRVVHSRDVPPKTTQSKP